MANAKPDLNASVTVMPAAEMSASVTFESAATSLSLTLCGRALEITSGPPGTSSLSIDLTPEPEASASVSSAKPTSHWPDATGKDANGDPTFADFTAVFAGGHDKSVAAVESGQCDVGFAEDTEADAATDLKVIDKQLVPGRPLVISSTLPQDVKDKLTAALSNVTADDIAAAGITVSDAFKSGFKFAKTVKPDFYDQILNICNTIEAAGCK